MANGFEPSTSSVVHKAVHCPILWEETGGRRNRKPTVQGELQEDPNLYTCVQLKHHFRPTQSYLLNSRRSDDVSDPVPI